MSRPDDASPSFLRRWSRLKSTRGKHGAEAVVARGDNSAAPARPCPPVDVAQVGADFDFAGFLETDASAELRREVMRRLWSSSAELFRPDGLDVYCEDFRSPRLLLANGPAELVTAALAAVIEPAREADPAPNAIPASSAPEES